ncbi:MAG: hypothetical protein IT363_10695 [Methanoregulaceae archaeon]|nr:hypothetical protein [Methanoregulaceae archaeon]
MIAIRWLLAGITPFGMTAGYAMALGWRGQDLFVGLPIAVGCLIVFSWAILMPHLDATRRCIAGFVGMSWTTMLIARMVPRLAPATWETEPLYVWTAIGAATTGIFALAFLVGAGFSRAVQAPK